jgi:hypothetical protein
LSGFRQKGTSAGPIVHPDLLEDVRGPMAMGNLLANSWLGKAAVRRQLSRASARGYCGKGDGLGGTYERAVFVWDVGGDGLTAAVLGAPKIHAPTPISKNKVSSVTETTAKL